MKGLASLALLLFAAAASAQSPADLPLLHEADFQYLGGFRVPGGTFGGSRFGYAGVALAFNPNDPNNPDDDSLFISGHPHSDGQVAEISIPNPVNSETVSDLPKAAVLQNFANVTKVKQTPNANYGKMGGLLVHDNQLIWTKYIFYDATSVARYSHGMSPLDLSQTGDAKGMFRVGGLNPGFVGGYMAEVPAEWQDELGMPLLTGLSNVPIISRTSSGPAAIGFDPADFDEQQASPAAAFVYYPSKEPLGGGMTTQNETFNFNSSVGGMVFPKGTSSIVYFGGHGTGKVCYGTGQECDDPYIGAKGWHDKGGNYVYQAWAYNANDLLAVKDGQKKPWEVQPYAVWNVEFPRPKGIGKIGGVAYDPEANRVFVVQYNGESATGRESQPLIHVYQVEPSSPPEPDEPPLPEPPVPEEPDPGRWTEKTISFRLHFEWELTIPWHE